MLKWFLFLKGRKNRKKYGEHLDKLFSKDYKDVYSYANDQPRYNSNGADGAPDVESVHRNTIDGKDGYVGAYGINLIKYSSSSLK